MLPRLTRHRMSLGAMREPSVYSEDALVVTGLVQRLGGTQDWRRRDGHVVCDPVQHRQEQHREGERETGRDFLLQARVTEEKYEKEQSEPQNVQREEQRRNEERGDRDSGRAAVELSLIHISEP